MSDMLNEKFEEFVTEQKVIVEAGDPMPTVSANVIPGTGSDPSQVSDAQTAKSSGKDPMPTVAPSVAPQVKLLLQILVVLRPHLMSTMTMVKRTQALRQLHQYHKYLVILNSVQATPLILVLP